MAGYLWLFFYRLLSYVFMPLAVRHLQKRLKRGKEHPTRWCEKLGRASEARPDGPLIWMHAVSVGEVMSTRALITALSKGRPEVRFLITYSTTGAANVFARQDMPQVVHQFLPLDSPPFVRRFLAHWRPDAMIWVEQDIWPNLSRMLARRGIPQVLINGRMNQDSYTARAKMSALWRLIYAPFSIMAAQDAQSARHISALSGRSCLTYPTLKSITPPLAHDVAALEDWKTRLKGRDIWCAASTHAADMPVIWQAHQSYCAQNPKATLILAPRHMDQVQALYDQAVVAGLAPTWADEPKTQGLKTQGNVIIDRQLGNLGLWYRLCDVALIGGSFGDTQGHNPWEALHLNCAVLHGPNVANFAQDYADLKAAGAAKEVVDASQLTAQLQQGDHAKMIHAAQAMMAAHKTALDRLFSDIDQILQRAK